MTLSDLSVEQQNDPHALAGFFRDNPTLLLDNDTCKQLEEWLKEGHPAVKYALSNLIALTDPLEQCEYDVALPYYVANESNFDFSDIDQGCLGEGANMLVLRQHLDDTETKLGIGEDETYRGCLNAIHHINDPETHLHPLLLSLYMNEVVSDKPDSPAEAYDQSAIIKEYWRKYSFGQSLYSKRYQMLREAFREIPQLPEVKKPLPIASQLSHSMSKAGVLKVDKGTQCNFNPSLSTQTEETLDLDKPESASVAP